MWSQLFQWAVHTAESQAQQAAIKGIQAAAEQLSKQVANHAPDVQAAVQVKLADIAAHAVSGVLTRKL